MPSSRSTTLRCLAKLNAEQPLLHPFGDHSETHNNPDHDQFSSSSRATKITVVGVGNVGMACAQTILTQELAEEIALIDIDSDKLRGEMLDLQHSAGFLRHRATISASTDFSISAGSHICILTAGARQRQGETRIDLAARNAQLYSKIVPEIVRHSPAAILLVVANPVDTLTWLTWKLSSLPAKRVFGSGTNLDTSRLRFLIAEHLGLNAGDVHGLVLGEHGDSSVPVWSSVSVAGSRLDLDRVGLEEIHRGVVESAYEVIRLKGYTSWAVGYSVASLVRDVVREQRLVCPVSVVAKGWYGIEEEVCLSLPVQLGRGGVVNVVKSQLSEEEAEKLQASAKKLFEIQQSLMLTF